MEGARDLALKMEAQGKGKVLDQFSNADNPLRGSPHTSLEVSSDNWNHEYSREVAAYPKSWLKTNKFWPSVGRVDNTHGDRNLICSCLDVESYSENNHE